MPHARFGGLFSCAQGVRFFRTFRVSAHKLMVTVFSPP